MYLSVYCLNKKWLNKDLLLKKSWKFCVQYLRMKETMNRKASYESVMLQCSVKEKKVMITPNV